ncbi:MAG: hypothetical protein ACHP65_00185 [Legionellales bacterium]
MKNKTTNYYILLLLALMFVAPGVTAYFFYQHPSWLRAAAVNKGNLLSPPLALDVLDAQHKWRIVIWSPGACSTACMNQLDTLARVRLALGRKLYYVDQWLILGEKSPLLTEENKSWLKDRDYHVVHLSLLANKLQAVLPTTAAVFIANPDNYLILSYQIQVNPNNVYADLKLLLNTTQTKSG